ncbi:DNA repair and recombination protein RAD52 [Pancytospora philotis]|nr:DNA repair and recombination protein RAD52 [Pancytospora philotis]
MAEGKRSFTAEERKAIEKKLKKCLGSEFIADRVGAGNMQMTYIQGGMIVNLANHIFGFDGWSNRAKSFTQEYCDVTSDGRYSVGISCCCRVTLRDGTYREDIGFGSIDNQRMKSVAVQTAKKKAATDALKRTLRLFGNALGNCLYDRGYLQGVKALPKKVATCYDPRKLLTNEVFTESPMDLNEVVLASLNSESFEFNESNID